MPITAHKPSIYNLSLSGEIDNKLNREDVDALTRAEIIPKLAQRDLVLPAVPNPTMGGGVFVARNVNPDVSARKLFKDLLKRECYQAWYSNTAPNRCPLPALPNLVTRGAKLSYRNKFRPDFCEVKYKDRFGVLRTGGLHPKTDGIRQAKPYAANSSKSRKVLQANGSTVTKHNKIGETGLKFRPLHKATRKFLEHLLTGRATFAGKFVSDPASVAEDFRLFLSEGPILESRHIPHLLREIVVHFGTGVDAPAQNRNLFEAGSVVLAHFLINTSSDPKSYLGFISPHYKSRPTHTSPEKISELLQEPEIKAFSNMLQMALTVQSTGHVQQDVHVAAGAAAMVIRAAYICAAHMDSVNEKHQRHVAFYTSLAFAVVGAVLAGVPLGVAAGVPTLIDPFEKLIEGKLDKHYNTGVLTSIVNRFIDTIEGNARSGAVVPGFRIRPNVNVALAGNDEVIEIRKQIGCLFNDELKNNLGSFYRSGMTPSNFYLR